VYGDSNLGVKSHSACGNRTLRVEINLVRVEITLVHVVIIFVPVVITLVSVIITIIRVKIKKMTRYNIRNDIY
jgi:hypothetical protein